MKGWRKPKAFAAAYSAQKRFLAFVLTLAMIFTSVGTDLNVSYAAQGNKVDFEIYGSDLVNAINEAVESDNVVKPDSLEFTNGAIDKFETLFYGEERFMRFILRSTAVIWMRNLEYLSVCQKMPMICTWLQVMKK